MDRCLVCHYHEIGLKGNNRSYFEERLRENMRRALGDLPFQAVRRLSGRLVVEVPDDFPLEEGAARLRKVFGLSSVSPGWVASPELDELKTLVWQLIRDRSFETFRITTRRADKRYPFTSQQVNEQVGAYVQQQSGRRVKLEDPDLNCGIELVGSSAFVYFDKLPAVGGLPVGASGKVVVLISGGIDSPVAAYRVMKRGCRAIFVHFHSFPHTTVEAQDKVRRLVSILSQYQYGADLFLVPFAEAQRQVVAFTPPETRVILYRRLMLRLAEAIARKRRALALVTGDSIGQVASQTLENLYTIGSVATLPVLRPLIGEDKEEIITQARRLGTFDTSVIQDVDCCSLFVPRHPETRSKPSVIARVESKLDVDGIVADALERTVIERIDGLR